METTAIARWDAATLLSRLKELGACDESLAWLGDREAADDDDEVGTPRSLAEVYEQLHRADWWLWLAARAGVDRRRVVLAVCACARTALRYVAEGETRPLQAIEMAERWARGESEVTLEQVRKAARTARHAADATYAAAAYAAAAYAYAAAYAAYAAYAAAYAAYAAADATYAAAAYAADAPAYAAAAARATHAAARRSARTTALADMMPLVREHLPLEVVALALSQSRTPAEVSSSP